MRGQEKVTKKKATPLHRPSGSRVETNRRALHQLALAGRTQRDPLRSSNRVPLFSRLFASTRRLSKGKPGVDPRAGAAAMIVMCNRRCSREVPFYVAEKRSRAGRQGAACLSPAVSRVVCGSPGRVAAPPRVASIAGEPQADIAGVAFSLVTFAHMPWHVRP